MAVGLRCVGLSLVGGLPAWVSGAVMGLPAWVCGHGLQRGSYFGCWLGLFADLILFCPNKLDDVSSYGWML
jgi:hypothetical protein